MTAANNPRAYVLALAAIVLWSTASTAFELALRQLSVLQLLLVASFSSLLAIGLVLVLQGQLSSLRPTGWRQLGQSALLGALNPTGYYLILLTAYDILPAQMAQPLNYTWPLVLVFLSAPMLKQRIARRSYWAMLVSFGGVILISSRGEWRPLPLSDAWGVFLAASSAVVWALYWLFNLRDPRPELVKLFYSFLFGSIFVLLLTLAFGQVFVPSVWGSVAAVYVGFFEMGFTFVLWMRALSIASSTDKIGNLVYLSPFLALLFISSILKESILPSTIFGLILILLGILIQKFPNKR